MGQHLLFFVLVNYPKTIVIHEKVAIHYTRGELSAIEVGNIRKHTFKKLYKEKHIFKKCILVFTLKTGSYLSQTLIFPSNIHMLAQYINSGPTEILLSLEHIDGHLLSKFKNQYGGAFGRKTLILSSGSPILHYIKFLHVDYLHSI